MKFLNSKITVKLMIKYTFILVIPVVLLLSIKIAFQEDTPSKTIDGYIKEYPPTTPENTTIAPQPEEVRVAIDAGHGGNDWGTYYGDIFEKNLNLDISLKLGALLELQSVNVIYTRTTDTFVGLQERAEIANNANATLFISIHNNKMPGNSSYRGTETLYAASSNKRFKNMSDKRLAEIVQEDLVKELKTVDHGIIYRPRLAVLHRTNMPAIITEIAYLSNKSDREKISTEAFRDKTAQAISKAVIKALGEMGAFKSEENKWLILP